MKRNFILLLIIPILLVVGCKSIQHREICSFEFFNYKILFEQIVNQSSYPSPYGESQIRIQVINKSNGKERFVSEYLSIENDGVALLCSKNIQIKKTTVSEIEFILKGEEQENESYKLNLFENDSNIFLEEKKEEGIPPRE
jgi:hypothetical protein